MMNIAHLTPAGLSRRVKRHLAGQTQLFLATTTPGFETVLEQEVRSLPGVGAVHKEKGGVEFSGPLVSCYHANLNLRTATRCVMRVGSFYAKSYPELFNKARRIPWELYSGMHDRVVFEVSSRSSRLHHTAHVAEALSAAFIRHMQELGVRAAAADVAPIRFHVRFAQDTCTVSIDSSGVFLYKRGYRRETAHAPLRETIAAGILQLVNNDACPVIADPLCGSGTFIIEAALMARNRAPGIDRDFAFFSWPSFKPKLWERLRREAVAAEKVSPSIKFVGSDISPLAVASAKSNAERASVSSLVSIECRNCMGFNSDRSLGDRGLIVSNLPYGKRAKAGHADLYDFYKRWGAHLRKYCRGWTYGFIVADPGFLKIVGLTGKIKVRFENGGIPVSLVTGAIK